MEWEGKRGKTDGEEGKRRGKKREEKGGKRREKGRKKEKRMKPVIGGKSDAERRGGRGGK